MMPGFGVWFAADCARHAMHGQYFDAVSAAVMATLCVAALIISKRERA